MIHASWCLHCPHGGCIPEISGAYYSAMQDLGQSNLHPAMQDTTYSVDIMSADHSSLIGRLLDSLVSKIYLVQIQIGFKSGCNGLVWCHGFQ